MKTLTAVVFKTHFVTLDFFDCWTICTCHSLMQTKTEIQTHAGLMNRLTMCTINLCIGVQFATPHLVVFSFMIL